MRSHHYKTTSIVTNTWRSSASLGGSLRLRVQRNSDTFGDLFDLQTVARRGKESGGGMKWTEMHAPRCLGDGATVPSDVFTDHSSGPASAIGPLCVCVPLCSSDNF